MLTASVVIHNTPIKKLQKTLDSLLKSSVSIVYIIDNGSSDSLKQKIWNDKRIIYFHVENRGYGAAHNYAIKKAISEGGDYHLLMNPDVYWDGAVLDNLMKFLQNNPEVGLISPKILYPDGSLQYSCRKLPCPMDLIGKRFLPGFLVKKRVDDFLLKNYDHTQPFDCPYLSGSFMLFRIKALEDCGLFDERFFLYPEDIDITRRIHDKWKTIYFPEETIFHEHQAASYKSLKMLIIHAVNMIRYFNKWGWIRDSQRKLFNDRLCVQLKKKDFCRDN